VPEQGLDGIKTGQNAILCAEWMNGPRCQHAKLQL
jgi:hypothetical protein